ncbi:ATP-binding protein [Stenotrophomonas sp. B1-1]|uniref:ATP-binding protein n=1 Tax=Stenotrophomonas sp. B1-1 TaxID=2710648 RepID=UPI0013DA404E|nr:ATP-binding protein [Stenotrophomonas sp. B1-1]
MNFGRITRITAVLSVALLLPRLASAYVESVPPLSQEQRAWIAAHPVVRYTTERGWPPVIEIKDGQPVGLLAKYIEHFSASTGLRFEYVHSASWTEAMALFEAGKVDMIPGVTRFHLRGFSSPPDLSRTFLSGSMIIIGRAEEGVAFSLDDLAGKRVAMQMREMAIVPVEQLRKIKVVPTTSVEETLKAVADGRADYLIGMEAIHPAFVRSRFIGKLGMAGTVDVTPLEAKIVVSAHKPELLGIINWAISQLSNEETDMIFEEAASQIQYGAPTLESLWRYRTNEILVLGLLLTSLAVAVVISLRARRQALRSEQGKARFLAMMSHEIRTPINVIVGSLEALERQRVQGASRRIVETMSLAADALTDLLDNVLDLSKLEAGKVTMERVAADPADLLRGVARLMVIRAEAKGLQLTLELDELPSTALELDTIRLRQVLSNLVGNAIKFTERGAVTLHASHETYEGRQWLRVDVRDTGVGIALADQAKLFRPYIQADSSSTRHFGGTGLGLAICRELIQLMEGTIWLHSEEGAGTLVSFRIPWLPTTALPARPLPEDPLQTTRPLTHLHVLVCDDNPLNLDVIKQQLQSLGASVDTVTSGEDTLEYLREESVDLLLLDCHMPSMDGYETAQRVRAEIDAALPIFAVSAASDAEHLQRCMDADMSAVLRKPIRTRELLGLLVLWDLVKAEDEEEDAEPATFQAEGLSPRPYLLDDLAGVQRATIRVDMDTALFHLHRIKGSAALFGMVDIEAEARRLEDLARFAGTLPDLSTLDALIHSQPES